MSRTTPGSDPIYKRLYAFPEMVEDLARSLFPRDALGAVDWPSLERLPTERVGADFRRRLGDAAWRVRARPAGGRGGWLHLLVLLEFQSTDDRAMALRVMEYTTMLYLELARQGALDGGGRLPPVLPVVLYNGDEPWRSARDVAELVDETGPALAPHQPSQRYALLDGRRAAADDLRELTRAVALLEQSSSAADLARVAGLLTWALRAPGRRELRRAFADWLWVLSRRLAPGEEAPPDAPSLEEVRVTLEERVSRWPEPYIRQGLEQGIEQGLEQGIERGLEQGLERGIERGVRQGLDRQRALLRRLAAERFGEDTAERLFARLRREESQQRLDEIGVAIVRCETGADLLRTVGA